MVPTQFTRRDRSFDCRAATVRVIRGLRGSAHRPLTVLVETSARNIRNRMLDVCSPFSSHGRKAPARSECNGSEVRSSSRRPAFAPGSTIALSRDFCHARSSTEDTLSPSPPVILVGQSTHIG